MGVFKVSVRKVDSGSAMWRALCTKPAIMKREARFGTRWLTRFVSVSFLYYCPFHAMKAKVTSQLLPMHTPTEPLSLYYFTKGNTFK